MPIISDINNTYNIPELGNADIKIGGDTVEFSPEARMSWQCESGQEQFWMKLKRVIPITNEKETLIDGDLTLKVGNNTDLWRIKDGHFKWHIEFAAKPLTNVFEWELTCTEGIKFSFQPTLEIQYQSYPDGYRTLEEFLSDHERPDKVVNSYAVYGNKANHILNHDGTTKANYKSGKLGHIYRPVVKDADGKEVWAEIFIDKDNNLLRLTIPQDFLDNAAYPVLDDVDIGFDQEAGTTYLSTTAMRGAWKDKDGAYYSTGADSDKFVSMSVWTVTGSLPFDGGVYDHDVANEPDILVDHNAGGTSVAGGWATASLGSDVSADPSTDYTIAFAFNAAIKPKYDLDVEAGYPSHNTNTTLSNPFAENANTGAIFSCYFTYSVSAGEEHIKNLSDTINMTDAIVANFGLNKADTISLSDSIAWAFGLNKADTINLTDSLTTKAIGLNKSDTINLSDSITKTFGLNKSDTITLSDALAKAFGLNKADTITLSDAISSKAFGLNKADTINLTDSIARAIAFKRSYTDTINMTDSISKSISRALADTINMSDSISSALVVISALYNFLADNRVFNFNAKAT